MVKITRQTVHGINKQLSNLPQFTYGDQTAHKHKKMYEKKYYRFGLCAQLK